MSLISQVLSLKHQPEIARAIDVLKNGGVVVIPTDTLYGLAADVFNERALQRVFSIKGRPARMALPVLVSSLEQAMSVSRDVSEVGKTLARLFWPGPLTLVFQRATGLSSLVTGGGETVAVRVPDHPVPLHLTTNFGPITGTSANLSGGPDLLTPDEIEAQLASNVDYIVRCGPAPTGISSTVVDVTGNTPKLLREGALPFEEILSACS